jgi:hypothetical protein
MGSPRIEGILDLQARRFKCHWIKRGFVLTCSLLIDSDCTGKVCVSKSYASFTARGKSFFPLCVHLTGTHQVMIVKIKQLGFLFFFFFFFFFFPIKNFCFVSKLLEWSDRIPGVKCFGSTKEQLCK